MVGALRNEVTIKFHLLIYMLGCGYSKCFGILFIIFLAVKFHIEFLHYLCSEIFFSILSGLICPTSLLSHTLISNFRLVLNVVCFLLGDSSASEVYMPTFWNVFIGG
jgi:hypothetical protein